MKPVAIVQHVANDGPSYFATWLQAQGLPYRVFAMHLGASLPSSTDAFSGLCILGGPMSANDPLPYFAALEDLIREAVVQRIPVIGHCLGGQLLSKALGGRVGRAEHAEIGWSSLRPVHADACAWLGDTPTLPLFQWHAESFSIPAGATHLLRGEHCTNQAFVVDDMHLGMQFHCEVDHAKVLSWLQEGAQDIAASDSPGVQDPDTIVRHLDIDLQRSQSIASTLYARWARNLRR